MKFVYLEYLRFFENENKVGVLLSLDSKFTNLSKSRQNI